MPRPFLWSLEQAVELCRLLSAHLKPVGYAVGLTGSVLTAGQSKKDLDLIVFPLDTSAADGRRLNECLLEFGFRLLYTTDVVRARWARLGSQDAKVVSVWQYEGKRVDLFFLS